MFNRSRWGRGVVLSATFFLALSTNLSYFFLVAPVPPALAGPDPVQVAYIAVTEDQVATYFQRLYGPSGSTIHTNISFTSAGDGVIVYYDHWEDGFEADIANPVQGSTQTWGDGDLTNGVAPGYPTDLIDAGDTVILENDIPTPRNAGVTFYDGGDKIGATRGIAITRAAWPLSPGVVAAAATSVYDTSRYGTSFTVPVGEDTPGAQQGTSSGMFDYTALSIMAASDGTSVDIDRDGDGLVDISVGLAEGQSYYVDGGVDAGATVTSDEPILVELMTGDSASQIEGRWFELLPTAFWADSYVTPVGTTAAGAPTDVLLYNPNAGPIDVVVTDVGGGAGTITIPANSSTRHRMASNSGARFASTGNEPFGAISTMDYDDSAHDWGFAVVPERLLTTTVVTGWAPGSSDGTANGSPVWATSPAATRLYVDYGNAAPGPLTDPNGDAYDVHFDISPFQQVKIFDPDLDQTGLRIYTLDDSLVSAAWGQDPATATPFSPYLDLGTSIFPFTALSVTKTATHAVDVNGNGLVEPGDQLEYRIAVSDAGNLALLNVVLADTVPDNTSYVAGSATDDGISIPDDTAPPAATVFPFDEGGYSIGTISPGQTVVIRFRVQIDSGLLPSVTSVLNTVDVTANNASATAAVETPVVVPDLSIGKSSSVSGSVRAGDSITYTIDIENIGSAIHDSLSVEDPTPTGTAWVSTTVTGPVVTGTGNAADDFSSGTYTAGTGNWTGPWTEVDGGTSQSPSSGDVQIVSNQGDQRLRIKDNDRDALRTADLSAFNSASLTYSFRRVNLDSGNDWVAVFIDDGTTRTELARYTGASVSTDAGYTTVSHDISAYIGSGTTTVSFESSGTLGNNDVVYFDDVDMAGETRVVQTYAGSAPPTILSGADLRPGETMSIDVVVTVDTPVAPGVTTISNTATVFSNVETAGQSAAAVNPLERIVDLTLTKGAAPDPVLAGQPLVYSLSLSNAGPDISTATIVTDTLPAGVTLVSAVPSQGSCAEAGGVVTCSLGDVGIGASATITITVTPGGGVANTTITNTAVASSAPTELVPADNTATADSDVLPAADLSVAKIDSVDPALAGITFLYTLTVTNAGPNDAVNTIVTDTLPAGLAFVSAVPDQGSCVEAAGVVSCSLGTVTPGTPVEVDILATPDVSVENTTVTNNASVASDTDDPVAVDNSASETTAVVPAADLHVTKVDDADPVLVGDTLTYTVTVLNEGVSAATNVVLTDTLPAGVSFVSAVPTQGSCSEAAGVVTCLLGALAATASADAVITVVPDPSVGNTTITNTASAVADEADPDGTDDAAAEPTAVDPKTDLALSKVAAPDPVLSGDPLTSTLTISNNGPSPSTGSTLTDVLPPGVAFDPASSSAGCSEAGGIVTCSVGPIAAGGSVDIIVVVDVDPSVPNGTILTNNASVAANEADPTPANDSASVDVVAATQADLSVSKADSVDPVLAGSSLTYTLAVTNNGPSDAQASTASDTLPAGVSFISAAPSAGSCSEVGGVVSCAFGTLAAGATATVLIAVSVPSGTASGTILTNAATVATSTFDPDAVNDSTTESTTVDTAADLSITKSDSVDPGVAGEPLTYTLTVANAGPSDALAVIATDTLPIGVTFATASSTQGSCAEAGGVVTCSLGTLVSGATATVTIDVDIDPDVADGTTLTNAASVASSTSDPDGADNTTSETTDVGTEADLSLSKSDTPDPVVAGESLTFTIDVSNAGPSDAQAVVVTDPLPTGVTFVSATPDQGSCSESAGTVTCSLGAIAAGGAASITILVDVDADVADGANLANTAFVASATSDPNAANDAAATTTAVTTEADVSVTKADSADPVVAGTSLTYTIIASNGGPSDAASVTVTDPLPAGVAFGSATVTGGSGGESCSEAAGTVTCDLGTVAAGAAETITVVVDVDPSVVDGAVLTNTASATTATADPVAANDSASEATTVAREADLAVTKVDSSDPATAGESFSYTVTVTNAGPSDAANVTLTDVLPSEVSFSSAVPAQGSCSAFGGTVVCSLGTVGNGATVNVVVTVDVPADASPGTITNVASVSALTTDPNPANDSTSEDTTLVGSADLSITKADGADPVLAGTTITYTLTVANAGPSDAAGVTVTDALPAGVTFVSALPSQGSCSEAGGTLTCSLGTVPDLGSATITLVVGVPSGTPDGTISNTATVSAATPDPSPADNSATEVTTVATEADLSVAIVDSADPVPAGATFSYTATITNAGPSDAAAAALSQSLAAEVSFVSAIPDQGSCSESAGTVTCGLGVIPAGGSVDVVITVAVGAAVPLGTIVSTTATVSTTTTDPVPANDTATEPTTVSLEADLLLTKADSVDPVVAGQTLTYTLTVANGGPSDAPATTVTDTLPIGTSFVGAAPSQGSCSAAAGTVTCSLGVVAAGGSATITIVVDVVPSLADGSTLTNSASVSSGAADPDASNDTAVEPTTVATSADLAVTKSDGVDPAIAGEPLSYVVTVVNNGPSDAQGVVLSDPLPTGLTFASATTSQGSCAEAGGTVTCSLGTVADGATVIVTIDVVVDPDVAEGASLSNTATVSSSTTDPVAGNDAATETTGISASADLSITKVESVDPVVAGETLSYTLTVLNSGPSDAQAVVITDPLPASVSFDAAGASQGSCVEAGGTVTCSLGTLAAGGSATVTVDVTVDPSSADGSALANAAFVSSTTTDPASGNDAAAISTTVTAEADLAVGIVDAPDPVTAGAIYSYTVTVSNGGPSDAQTAALDLVLPPEVSLVSAVPDQGSCSEAGGTVTCGLGVIASGGTLDVVVTVTVPPATPAGTLSASASVSTSTVDTDASNDTAAEVTTVTTSADLAVSKADDVDPVVAGAALSYTVSVTNAGPSDAALVVLSDTLPAGVTFVSATPDQGTCSEAAGTVTCSLGTLAAGAVVDVAVDVTVDASTLPGTLTNTATVSSSTADPDATNNSDSEATTVITEADLGITKSDDVDPVTAGTGLRYTLTVTNAGPSNATSVAVADALPSGVSFVAATPGQGSCSEAGGTITCSLGSLAVGASTSIVVDVTVDADTPAGPITNVATVSSAVTDPNGANDTATEGTTVATSADVGVAIVDAPDPVTAGTTLTYTVTVVNGGPSDATTVDLAHFLPAEVTFVGAVPDQGTCSEVAGTVSCGLGSVPAGATVEVVVTVTVDAGTSAGTISSTASVSTATADANPANDTDGETTAVVTAADLSVGKTDSIDPVAAGASLTYTVTVTNSGPSDAAAVTLSDDLPAAVGFVAAFPDQGSCAESAGTVSCSLGTVLAGSSVAVAILVSVPPATPPGTVTNTAAVTAATSDPDATNNTTAEETSVVVSADLAVSKIDSSDPVVAGNGLTYTVTVANAGSSDAVAVTMTDTLPAGVTFQAALPDQGSCGEAAGVITCALGTIGAGATVDVLIDVTVDPGTPAGTITNTAAVASATADPNGANDTTSEDTTVSANADVGVVIVDAPDPVPAGATLTYTVTVANSGPSDATAVDLSHVLAPDTSFAGAVPDQGTCGESGGTVSCSLGTLAPGASVDVVVTVIVASSTVPGSISTTASVATTATDTNGANDADIEITTVTASADLSVAKADDVDPVAAGTTLTYTVSVANVGPSDATDVTLSDTLPVEVAFVSATPDQGSCSASSGTVTCSLGSVPAGATLDVVIVVTVDAGTASGTIANSAAVSSSTPDPDPGDNGASEDTLVTSSADLDITKSDDVDPVDAGGRLTYTVTVTNGGPSEAAGVTVTDTLPVEAVFVSAVPDQGSCSEAAGIVTCSIGTVAPGGVVDVVVVVDVEPGTAAGSITNSAAVGSSTPDPDVSGNTVSEPTTVATSSDLALAIADDPDGVAAGGTLTYTLDVTNAGPSDAAGAMLTQTLPAGVTFVSATVTGGSGGESCGEAGGTITCSLLGITSGSTETVTVVVTVDGTLPDGTVLITSGAVSAATSDPDPANDVDTEDTTVAGTADVSIAKSDDADPVVAGTDLTYTLVAANLGLGLAPGTVVTDTLPAGLAFVSATVGGGDGSEACAESAGTVTCALGDVVLGSPETITIVAFVADTTPAGTVLSNTASITTLAVDPVPANNTATETTTVSTSADLAIVKVDDADPVVAGSTLTYLLTVGNAGPSLATAVTVADALPAGVSYVSSTVAGGSGTETCTELGGAVSCDLGLLGNGASEVISITVSTGSALADGSSLVNTATVTSATADPDPTDNSALEPTTIATEADLAVSVVDSADPVTAGTAFSYVVTVANNGPSDAQLADLSFVLAAGTTFVSASPDQGSCGEAGGTVSCGLGSIAAGSSVDVTITASVDADTPGGTLTADALVSSVTTDPVPANNVDSEDTAIVTAADLAITKVDDADPVVAGGVVSYSVSVANAGPSEATAVTITDVLPAGVAFVSAVPSQGACSETSGTVTCSLGTVADGATATISISASVDPSLVAGSTITNTATVSAATLDPAAANDTASATTTISTDADLSIAKAASADPVVAGEALTYTLTVTNAGPSDAASVNLVDPLPAGVSFSAATTSQGSCVETAGTVDCSLGIVASGAAVTVTIDVLVDSDVADGTVLTNDATVSTSTTDPVPANDSASVATTVATSADLSLSKVDDADPVVAGTALSYAITVTNAGPSWAAAPIVTDTLPAGLTFVSATGGACSEAGGTVTCTLASLAPGGSRVVSIDVLVPPDAGGSISNTATVASSTADPDAANDTDSESTTVVAEADLWITKSSTPQPFAPGGQLTYTVTVGNDGPSAVVGARVTDTLPSTLLSPLWTCAAGAGSSCPASGAGDLDELVDLPPGATVVFTIVSTVDPGTPSGAVITNTATVAAPAGVADPDPGDNSATDSTPGQVDADVSVAKSASTATVTPGSTLTYTIVVTNAGPATATDAVVTDALPPGLAFVSGSVAGGTGSESCGSAAGTVTCALGSIAPGSAETITLVASVDPAAAGSIVNEAAVTTSTNDPDPANDRDQASVSVVASADLSISKTATPSAVSVGGTLVFTVTVTNHGPSTATSVTVTDVVPSGMTIASAAGDQGSCTLGSTVVCSLGSLPSGDSATITMTATVNAPGSITNSATATSSTADPDLTDNTDSATVGVASTGSVRSLIWWDLDADGLADGDEPPMAGVVVRLYDGSGAWVASATTDADGIYRFAGLEPGSYEVRVDAATVPAGATLVSDPDGVNDGVALVSVSGGVETAGLDFGYAGQSGGATLAGVVYHDVDGSGAQQLPFEPGVPFVGLDVRWAGPDGVVGNGDDVLYRATTDGFGRYALAGLPAGAYEITLDGASLPVGMIVLGPDSVSRNLAAAGAASADFALAVNTAPDAVDDAAQTPAGVAVTISLLINDTDPEGDPLEVVGLGDPANGTVELVADGTVTYTPAGDFAGIDTFTYTISDANGGTDTATVTVTVTSTNTAPQVVGPPSVPVEPGAPLPPLPIVDAEGDDITIELVDGALPPGVELIDGRFVGAPTQEGVFEVVLRLCDDGTPPTCSQTTLSYAVGELPYTGTNSGTQMMVALTLILLGALLLVAARRGESRVAGRQGRTAGAGRRGGPSPR